MPLSKSGKAALAARKSRFGKKNYSDSPLKRRMMAKEKGETRAEERAESPAYQAKERRMGVEKD